jgi:putative Holliday junction resolvase
MAIFLARREQRRERGDWTKRLYKVEKMSRRVVAIDLGTRRVGVAVSDGLGLTAQPLETIARKGGQRDLDAIAAVVARFDAERVVLGLPLSPEGAETPASRSVRAFAERRRAALSVPVELLDESFTTVEAEEVLLQADLSRARRKQVVDRVAAALILDRWLRAREKSGVADGGQP